MNNSPFPDFPDAKADSSHKNLSEIPLSEVVGKMLDFSSGQETLKLDGKTLVHIILRNGSEVSFLADRNPLFLFSVYNGVKGKTFEWLNDDNSYVSVARKEILSVKFERVE